MTVTYTSEVATSRVFGSFWKLLFRWRGSIYKVVWRDLLLFLALYYVISIMYYFGLNETRKQAFEKLVEYCAGFSNMIPLSFVLGFYVSLVMVRWWDQYMHVPWPDSLAVYVSAHIHGHDEGGRVMRRTIMRYACVCCTMVLRMISPGVMKRFPTLQHLVDAGLLQEGEKNILLHFDEAFPEYPKHWMPIVWATSIVTRARKEGRIRDDYSVKTLIESLNGFRGECGILIYYDYIPVPLVYTQVVTIAVYSYFACNLLAHQWTRPKQNTDEALDFYIPLFMTLHFFFYMGWLKVAEILINPFGDDDDDFEVNWLIDRHLQVSYMIVDEMHQEHPELVKDPYWDEVLPNELPYDTDVKRNKPPEHSTAKYDKMLNATSGGVYDPALIRGSMLSQRSAQFNENFQYFGVASDEVLTQRDHSKMSTSSAVSMTETVRSVMPYDARRFSYMDDYALDIIPELLEEEIAERDDEYDKMIESRSKSIFSSTSMDDLFEKLRIQRQQKRIKQMSDYLEKHFGSNFKLVYSDMVRDSELLNYAPEIKERPSRSRQSFESRKSEHESLHTFRLVPQLGLQSSERISVTTATVGTSPFSSATSISTPEE